MCSLSTLLLPQKDGYEQVEEAPSKSVSGFGGVIRSVSLSL